MIEFKFKSPAKLNLVLQVINKRKDGYHNIKSIMQKICLFDNITLLIEKSNKLSINIKTKGFYVPSDENNLCYKTIMMLARNVKDSEKLKRSKITINLTKNIPVSSGLGGGSSNAGTLLTSLNKLLELNLNKNELIGIAGKIGSDVPFFVSGYSTCFVEGKGDKIRRLPEILHGYAILVKPDFDVSAKFAYEEFDKKNKQKLTKKTDFIKISRRSQFIKGEEMKKIAENLYNDLESVVANKYREIYDIKKTFLKLGALGSVMSGSGSTVFGLTENEKDTDKIYNFLKNSRMKNYWIKKVRISPLNL